MPHHFVGPTHPPPAAAVAFLNKLLINPALYTKYAIAPTPINFRNCNRDIFFPHSLSELMVFFILSPEHVLKGMYRFNYQNFIYISMQRTMYREKTLVYLYYFLFFLF
jgi:hypothetical protein